MAKFPRGLYESLVTDAIDADLRAIEARLVPQTNPLHSGEAADRIALHIAQVVKRAIGGVDEAERVALGIDLARKIISQITSAIGDSSAIDDDNPLTPGTVFRALLSHRPDGSLEDLVEPLTPLLDTTLLTNAPGEPRVGNQLRAEICSADRIDVVMAFIRKSGITPLLNDLRRHCEAGRPLRILTTTYTGSTEAAALDALQTAGADIRVSYDTTTTRLHAKAWLFHRNSGFPTAYIGSSNLTHSAQTNGLEWNLRVSGARNPDVVEKFSAVFDSYWNNDDFIPYDREQFDLLLDRTGRPDFEIRLSPIELRPEPFQERLLEQIALSRFLGHHRNLLVSATGTGKTVMAAIDYARLRSTLSRSRLLFVAHREEILKQSQATFCHALRDASFGELWVGGKRPRLFDHVFASVMSLNGAGLTHIEPDHFDVVIIDEFHHAAAPSYTTLLEHLRPVELLGLTATPERSDGLDVLRWFDNRFAAELRLWDAIEQQRLAPFAYFGVADGLDLRGIPWRRGQYDFAGLTNLLTANDVWAKRVIKQVQEHVDSPSKMRALGFCVSVDHARFMARVFNEVGIPSKAIWADSPDEERKSALTDLADRRINVLFSVDIFNEGVDVPEVDTLLMLRPTDSPTLFLQQLGRGLRKNPGKTVCTVLDFVGQHRKEFRFEKRFKGLFRDISRKELVTQIESGFPFLPAGCHMELDPVATDTVLRNIREAIPSRWPDKVADLRRLVASGKPATLATYLEETGLGLDDVYQQNRSWSELKKEADLLIHPPGAYEEPLGHSIGRMLHIDDSERIGTYRRLLATDVPPNLEGLPLRDRRLLQMLATSMTSSLRLGNAPLSEGVGLLWTHPQIRAELLELLDVLADRVDHLHAPVGTHPDVPLQIHARYSRLEILAAFASGEGIGVPTWREGVRYDNDSQTDLFAITFDKTFGHFSPTTRYHDYAISRDQIHWKSQSRTKPTDPTGKRYQSHVELGSSVFLFARLRTDARAFWFLGPATYVEHTGERPMSITWRLHHPLPGDLYAQFAAAVA